MATITKDMSPIGAALFNAMRPGTPMEQLERLSKLPNQAMQGFSVARAIGEIEQCNQD